MDAPNVIPTPSHIEKYIDQYITILIDYSPKLISAILIAVVGLYAIKFIDRIALKIMIKKNIEPTLTTFANDIITWTLRILLFVTVISKLGLETSSFVAILGALGLAIGLSLQGSLSNFAGGMLIVIFKPFKVGDSIEAQGVAGTVSEIHIFTTKLITGNNQTIFIPNGSLSNGIITNHSAQGTRRADLPFSVSYNTDLKQTKEIILKVMNDNPKVLQTPAPAVLVTELTDSGVKLAIRPWSKTSDFATVNAEVLEGCKIALAQAGVDTQPYVKEHSIEE